jgi:hypothetical protein
MSMPQPPDESSVTAETGLQLRPLPGKMPVEINSAFLSLRREVAVNERLRNANNRIDTLQELLPVCANCKKVRDDNGYWEQIELYIHSHLDVSVSHGICPDCIVELYPELPGDKR